LIVIVRPGEIVSKGVASLVSVILTAFAVGCSRTAERPVERRLPQVSGTLVAVGLSAPVQVVRDKWGVPHITAANQDDLFFAQGFVQAQDRLFQIDLWRRSAQGRLSEVLGPNFIERDAMTRRMQYRGDRETDWASSGPDAKAIATAFTRGINAWIRIASDPLPEEFRLAGWAPERWFPEDLLNRTDAFVDGSVAQDDVFRSQLAVAIGPARASVLLPAPPGSWTVPAGLDLTVVSPLVAEILRRVGTPPFFTGLAARIIEPSGSNAWAVARGDRGRPLVAGDPHRVLAHPSIRYLVHLRAPGWNVAGATSPWRPGVAIGHNERVAWSMTSAAAADTQDIYVEQVNPDSPRQVLAGGGFVDMTVEQEIIAVKGRGEPFDYERLHTSHGVIVALDRDRHLAFSIRWSGTEPGTAPELGALAINRASSAAEFRSALSYWKMPASEFVFADLDGHIGRQVAALVPRRPGWSGALPVPGEKGQFEWRDWLTADDLPHEVDPSSGRIVSASGNRARLNRITAALGSPEPASSATFEDLQYDVLSWNAQQIVPLLNRVKAEQSDVERSRQRLLGWDRRVTADSEDARLYVRWETQLKRDLALHRIPEWLVDAYVARAGDLLIQSVTSPSSLWFDGNVQRARDELLTASLAKAASATDKAKTVTFAHPLAVTEDTRRRFNIGPFPLPGYSDTVLATGDASASRPIGPSLRVVMDTADWDQSKATNAPGQSEAADSPHFRDLASAWAAGEYFPLSFSEEAIRANTESVLVLTPR
jgi:penicillin amidase